MKLRIRESGGIFYLEEFLFFEGGLRLRWFPCELHIERWDYNERLFWEKTAPVIGVDTIEKAMEWATRFRKKFSRGYIGKSTFYKV